jgi:hypothetical protein
VARHRGAVLLDTNAIIEAWRVGGWRALSGGYRLETVEDCVIETQTGFQRRRREEQIDEAVLKQGFIAIHQPSTRELADLALGVPDIALDPGERALWAHAVTRADGWIFCGPDIASLRVGVRLSHRERLVALETLLDEVGLRPKPALRVNYTHKWLAQVLSEIVVIEGARRS